jgi:hypothetical protein
MTRSTAPAPRAAFPLALDRAAIALSLLLLLVIGLLLWVGDRTSPHVRSFSWQNKQIGADDTAFVLTFSRPMDHASVEKNLVIDPPLLGKPSWAGRRMAYTLTAPAAYGKTHEVRLQDAFDYFSQQGTGKAVPVTPFKQSFRTRDRAFAYIGVQGEEAGRLMLCQLSGQVGCTPLTPPSLVVNEFKSYPLGDRILVAATNQAQQNQGLMEQQLYQVWTGIVIDPPIQIDNQSPSVKSTVASRPAGTIELVLDNAQYQNLKFDLSADGSLIVVQRVSRTDPADFGPWLVRQGQQPEPLRGQPGGDFLITPDSESLAISQGQGLAILPLIPDAKPLDFLPKFGVVLNFSRDGSLAAMVKFNTDRTRSLFLIGNQGMQKELLRIPGSIFAAEFDPTKKLLYCLLSELIPGETYQEKPFLAAIDLESNKLTPLIDMPNQREVKFSLSPDGLAILFDQISTTEQTDPNATRDRSGRAIGNSRLLLLPVNSADLVSSTQVETLPMPGLRPQWLP